MEKWRKANVEELKVCVLNQEKQEKHKHSLRLVGVLKLVND